MASVSMHRHARLRPHRLDGVAWHWLLLLLHEGRIVVAPLLLLLLLLLVVVGRRTIGLRRKRLQSIVLAGLRDRRHLHAPTGHKA